MVVDHTMVVVYHSLIHYGGRAAESCEGHLCHCGHALPQRNMQSRESLWKALSAKNSWQSKMAPISKAMDGWHTFILDLIRHHSAQPEGLQLPLSSHRRGPQ